jgi:pimeloyl-ACP methyl ester carboxylesterase
MIRQGAGEPLVLLHGVLSSEHTWSHVVPLLAADYDVIALTALGHHGGSQPTRRPVTFEDVVDDMVRRLDELGLDQPHVAGNSMGGWIGIELARRGRARSVCGLSPAGAWDASWADKERVFGTLRSAVRDTRRSRRILPLLARSPRFRGWAMSETAAHGERISRADFLDGADAVIGCSIAGDLLGSEGQLAPLDPTPCPITLAWSERDKLFPVDTYGARAQEMIPGARFVVLDDVGHVPMIDDPRLVAETILATASLSASPGEVV